MRYFIRRRILRNTRYLRFVCFAQGTYANFDKDMLKYTFYSRNFYPRKEKDQGTNNAKQTANRRKLDNMYKTETYDPGIY